MRVAGWLMGCLPVMVADWPGWGMGMQRGLFLGTLQGRGYLRRARQGMGWGCLAYVESKRQRGEQADAKRGWR